MFTFYLAIADRQ